MSGTLLSNCWSFHHNLTRVYSYFSYGAVAHPRLWSVFRPSYRILEETEGPNDGLVSVYSSQWGAYKGTLMNVSHLELINWTNQIKWLAGSLVGRKRKLV